MKKRASWLKIIRKTTDQLDTEKNNEIERDPQDRQQIAWGCSRSWHWIENEEFFHYLSRIVWALRTGTLTTEKLKAW